VKDEVAQALQEALRRYDLPLGLFELAATVGPVPPGLSGDASTSVALSIAKQLKRKPRDVADEIRGGLVSPLVARTEVAGPGFINISFSGDWLAGQLREILTRREAYGARAGAGREKTLVEFVSANPNGPLHVGHGRGAALGDSLARILRHLGHPVQTEYYVNDVGNQMRNLGASVMWRCRELKADFLDADENAALDGWNKDDLYKGEYLVETAREVVAKFGADRPRGVDFFRKVGLAFMLQLIQKDLNAFRVEMNGWFSESQLYEKGTVDKALETLRAGGHLKDEDGALWFVSTAFGDDKDRVIKRKDERPTYFASDIAYHGLKFERGFERLVDIWGTDHHGYVKRVKSAVQALGRDPEKLDILLYQLVSLVRDGKPVAMSTRSGEFVTLREVVDEVGADAARFFFAMRSPNSQLEFDLELAKKQAPENPVFYVQYVHARCCSLFREAEKRGVRPGAPDGLRAPAELEPAERALLLRLASYPDVVQLCGRDLTPHHLTVFLMSLAGDYHRFYEQCRVLGDAGEATSFRLALVDGVRTLIRSGLSLIGVTAPETM
jgi:arginyl-tRNA synthetase